MHMAKSGLSRPIKATGSETKATDQDHNNLLI